jgi:excisionase family DNA binding protein
MTIGDSERMTILTAREAAEYLRVSLSTLRRMERNGSLTPLRTPGGHRRYSLRDLNACLVPSKATGDDGPIQE